MQCFVQGRCFRVYMNTDINIRAGLCFAASLINSIALIC
jgi:hypothetical protein